MIQTVRRYLGVKLFLSYIFVILVGALVIAGSARFSVPQAFNRHMGMMAGGGQGWMQAGNTGRGMMMSDLFQGFQATFNEALLLSMLAAGLVAILVSFLLSRGVVASVRAMTAASQRIADGHYEERVPNSGEDELGQLGRSFNQMAGKLQQVETKRQQMIGDISHELRTPLTAIKGSMEALMDGVLPANAETYQQIHQETDRLARLVDDLQELSRVEAGVYSLELRPANLSKMIETSLKRLSVQAEKKNIQLRANLPADLPPVLADMDRITQVLTNLIGNAVQYTPQGGRVTVAATRNGERVTVRVTDTGIGIPREHLAHIFDRFYRVDKSRSRQSGGSGIGLTIARHLVEAHGGALHAESGGEGQGSTFSFTLPTAQ